MFGDIAKQQDLGILFFSHVEPDMEHIVSNNQLEKDRKISCRGRPKGEKNNTSVTSKKKKDKQQNQGSSRKTGHWSYQQNKRYHWFLQIYSGHFLNKHLRRTDKIFKTMQIFLGTRQAEQCRSHHQKMQKKHKTFQSILLHLRRHFYNTQQNYTIAEDIQRNNYQLNQQLVSRQELLRLNEQEYQNTQYQKNKQGCLKQQNGNQLIVMHFQEESKALENFFSDKYENNMDFKSFM